MAALAPVRMATSGYCTEIDGVPTFVQRGDLVRVGHPVMKGHEDKFEPLRVKFDHVEPKGK